MHKHQFIRGLLSVFLAAVLVLPFGAISAAAEESGERAPSVVTEPAETQPPETTEESQPPETETAEAEAEPSIPQEAFVAEESHPPVQEAVTVSQSQRVSVSWAKNQPAGTENLAIRGTVVYDSYEKTVIQDDSGGILLTLSEGTDVTFGDVLDIVGSRSETGMQVQSVTWVENREPQARETTLDDLGDCVYVAVKNVTYVNGQLMADDMTQVSLSSVNTDGLKPGMRVDVWGVSINGTFYIREKELHSTELKKLPPVTQQPSDSLLEPDQQITLHCEEPDVTIYYEISYTGEFSGTFLLYEGPITVPAEAEEIYIRAYGEKEGYQPGSKYNFYFCRSATPPQETGAWNFYFGQLHAHSGVSQGDGTSPVEHYAYAAGEGLDFYAVTDYSHSLDHGLEGSINEDGTLINQDWAEGKQAAKDATTEHFVGIFGYEMKFPDQKKGHFSTFHTLGWQAWGQEGFTLLEDYYEVLPEGSITQLNHPGPNDGNFENFGHYKPQYDPYVQLIEVGQLQAGVSDAYQIYTDALDQGWHVAPTNNQDNQDGNWMDAGEGRTVILAQTLTEEALYEAMDQRRVYATEDRDLEILYHLNDALMGSTIQEPGTMVRVLLQDPTDPEPATVEVVASGGVIRATQVVRNGEEAFIPVSGNDSYYYLRITQADGDVAVTAPVWVDLTDEFGILSFDTENKEPIQGQEVEAALTLYNDERRDFILTKVEYFLKGESNLVVENPGTVPALGTLDLFYPVPYYGLGAVEIKAVVEGTMDGKTHTFENTLTLYYQSPEEVSPSTISAVRSGTQGTVYRIQGHVTAGTSNPYNTFPGMIYLQDETGGIAVADFLESGVQIGAPLDITGYLDFQDGNPVLARMDNQPWDQEAYNYVPETMDNKTAMDYAARGGELTQIEGTVVSFVETDDGKGVKSIQLKDIRGDMAKVEIEDNILSGATGENTLLRQVKMGRTVRAIGLLHRNADGEVVLRVRNCDEVVYVPPIPDPTNPKTADAGLLPAVILVLSAAGLLALQKKQKTDCR